MGSGVAWRRPAAGFVPVSGAAICAWLLLQPVTGHHSPIIAASIFGAVLSGFRPSHWLRLRDLQRRLLLAPPYLAELGGPAAQTWHSPCGLPAGVATDTASYVIGRRLGRHPLSRFARGRRFEAPSVGWPECCGRWRRWRCLLGWPWLARSAVLLSRSGRVFALW